MKKNIAITIISALALLLCIFLAYDKIPPKEEFNEQRLEKLPAYVELANKNEKVIVDDNMTIEFLGEEDKANIYSYIAKIYYDGKLIEDNMFSNPNSRIIWHSSSQLGGLHIEKINNVYFISTALDLPNIGNAVVVISEGKIIDTFKYVTTIFDEENKTVEVYNYRYLDFDKISSGERLEIYQLYQSTTYNILENSIEKVNK